MSAFQSANPLFSGLARLAKVLDELAALTDREERAEYLIETAARYTDVPRRIASRPYPESRRVPGCESEAFVFAEHKSDGTVSFAIAVENPQGISAKALAVILQESLSGLPAATIQEVPEEMVYEIFGSSLSMGKGQGLMGMVRSAKFFAASPDPGLPTREG